MDQHELENSHPEDVPKSPDSEEKQELEKPEGRKVTELEIFYMEWGLGLHPLHIVDSLIGCSTIIC